jgi:hypothetical protein
VRRRRAPAWGRRRRGQRCACGGCIRRGRTRGNACRTISRSARRTASTCLTISSRNDGVPTTSIPRSDTLRYLRSHLATEGAIAPPARRSPTRPRALRCDHAGPRRRRRRRRLRRTRMGRPADSADERPREGRSDGAWARRCRCRRGCPQQPSGMYFERLRRGCAPATATGRSRGARRSRRTHRARARAGRLDGLAHRCRRVFDGARTARRELKRPKPRADNGSSD